jgi:hypothetical protein
MFNATRHGLALAGGLGSHAAVAGSVCLMIRLYRPNSPYQRAFAEQKRHNEALEKILASIDARLQKIEDKRSQISN